MIHMPHIDSCVIKKCHQMFGALAARVREMFQERFVHHHLLRSFYLLLQTDKCQKCQNTFLLSSPLAFMPLALQSSGSGNITHVFHSNSLCQLYDLPFISEHLSCVGDPVASGANCLWLEATVIHHRCATSSNNQIPFLAILTEIGSQSTPPPVSCKPCSVGLAGAVWVSVGR